ncbi:IclR family transcriptional regulator [Saliphagus sp. GCM10025317]
MATEPKGGLQTTETSLRIINALKALDGARVTQLASELDMAPSTVHGHLATLEQNEFVVKRGDIYYLGLRFLTLGEYVRNNSESYIHAKPKVKQLAEETGGRAHFVVEEHGRGVYLYTSTGEKAVKAYSSVGKRVNLHVAAAGKSILAFIPEQRVEEIIDECGLEQETEHTITDPDALFDELAEIRERGYAFNREEHIKGVNAIGAPVLGPDDRVVGAFSVSGPVHRMKGDWYEEELPNMLLATSNELELNIMYS